MSNLLLVATMLCLLTATVAHQVAARSPTLPATPEPDDPANSTANAQSQSGIRGYRRFHANDSHIGKPVPCTHDEKVCFKYNLMFSRASDKCEAMNDGGHSCFLAADRQEYEHGSGHIVGVCRKYWDSCRWWIGYRMAFDNRCYDKNVTINDICGCNESPTPNFLGGDECRCSSSAIIDVKQPDEEGKCLIPDFRNPRPKHLEFYNQPLKTLDEYHIELNCSAEQRRCFEQDKVQVSGSDGCHALLKRGPCPLEYVVAIDGRASQEGRAEGVCIHERGNCPPGQKRMAFDGECYADRDIAIAAPGVIVMNAYGVQEVLYYAIDMSYPVKVGDGDMCVVRFSPFWPPINPVDLPGPTCTDDDPSQCDLLKVVSTAPEPQILSEAP